MRARAIVEAHSTITRDPHYAQFGDVTLDGKHFWRPYGARADTQVHQMGPFVQLDNGAFSKFTRQGDGWGRLYTMVRPLLDYPNTWAVIPAVTEAGSQDRRIDREWPMGSAGRSVAL